MEKRKAEQQRRATESLLERFLSVRDNLQRAIDQDEDVDIRDGVESTLRQFDDVLDAEGIERIEPEAGADVDPHRHEVLARVDAEVPADTVAEVHRPGYAMEDSVLREAQVTVSEASETSAADGSEESGDEDAGAEPEAGSDETESEERKGTDGDAGSEPAA
jgi:molecular chaperone GrpE